MEHGWLTTLRRDGSPRTSRVWFVEHSEAIWVATSESNRKVADLARDARFTFAVEGRHGATSGHADIVSIESQPTVTRLFAEQYGGWDAADPSQYGPRLLIRLPTPPAQDRVD